MSRRRIFLIIYGLVMLFVTVLAFLDVGGTLLAKFFVVILSGFLVFFFLGSMWLVWERDEARRNRLQENSEDSA